MEFFIDHFLDIKKFKYWTLGIHSNQYYLGRVICYISTYKENLTDLKEDEYLELLKVIKIYQNGLTKLWQPDWWNYAQLGNITPHLHFHFIPRYKEKRVFENMEFIDKRWGKNYAPTPEMPENKALNQKIKLAIRDAIG